MTHRWGAGGLLSERDGLVLREEERQGRERARLISQRQAQDKITAVRLAGMRDQAADRHAMAARQSYVDRATAHITFAQKDAVDLAWNSLRLAEGDAITAREALEKHEADRPNESKKVKAWAKLKAELDAELSAFTSIFNDRQAAYDQAVQALDRAKQRAFDTLVTQLDNEIENDLKLARVELADLRDQFRRRKAELDAALDAKAKRRWQLAGKPFRERRADQRPTFDRQAADVMQLAEEEQYARHNVKT